MDAMDIDAPAAQEAQVLTARAVPDVNAVAPAQAQDLALGPVLPGSAYYRLLHLDNALDNYLRHVAETVAPQDAAWRDQGLPATFESVHASLSAFLRNGPLWQAALEQHIPLASGNKNERALLLIIAFLHRGMALSMSATWEALFTLTGDPRVRHALIGTDRYVPMGSIRGNATLALERLLRALDPEHRVLTLLDGRSFRGRALATDAGPCPGCKLCMK